MKKRELNKKEHDLFPPPPCHQQGKKNKKKERRGEKKGSINSSTNIQHYHQP